MVGYGQKESWEAELHSTLHWSKKEIAVERKIILLVEDSDDDVELTLRALKKASVANEVVVARDGVEALDYLRGVGSYEGRDARQLPALVLLDIKLPKMDGLQVLKQIRQDEETSLLPVVILTSSREEQDILNGYQLGCNSYIRKPVSFVEFAEAVKNLGLYWLVLNEAPPDRR
jgi:two-component system response regulator